MISAWLIILLISTLGNAKIYQDEDFDINNELNPSRFVIEELTSPWLETEALSSIGIISSVSAMNPTDCTDMYLLHRFDREWNESTFDHNNNYTSNHETPIDVDILVHLKNGRVENSFLKSRFFMPHGLHVDPKGFVWITDVALHQVFKFAPDLTGEPLLVLGKRFKPGNSSYHFCQPSDVVVAQNGQIFVADGYCNSRILKFSPDGKLMNSWGHKTRKYKQPGHYNLDIPHQLALDENGDCICVADRNNGRVVCYTAGLYDNRKAGAFIISSPVSRNTNPVFGVAINPLANMMFVLFGSTPRKDSGPARIEMVDLETENVDYLTETNNDLSFNQAHWISTKYSNETSRSCLAVSSLLNPNKNSNYSKKRIWMFELEQVALDNDYYS